MTYTDPYPGGFKDKPDVTTPVTAAVLNGMRLALKDLYTPTPVTNGVMTWDGAKFTAAAPLADAQIASVSPVKLIGYPSNSTVFLRGDGTWALPVAQAGPQGPIGPTGPTGPAGATGQAEAWWAGAGAPSAGLGAVGDWYLNTTTGDVYEKTGASTWTLSANIKGPTGATGPTGPAGASAVYNTVNPIASASTLTLPAGYPNTLAYVTGTTRINLITSMPTGYIVTLQALGQAGGLPLILTHVAAGASGRMVLRDAKDVGLYNNLNGISVDESITLISNGNDWTEIGRSVVTVLDYVQITASPAVLTASDVAQVTSSAITFDGTTPMKIEVSAGNITFTASAASISSIYDGGSLMSLVGNMIGAAGSNGPFLGVLRLTPTNGSHTYSWRMRGAGNQVTAGVGVGGTWSPAYIKISRDL